MKYLSIFLLATFALAGDAPISTDSKGSPSLIAKFERHQNQILKVLSNSDPLITVPFQLVLI